jgi:transposase
MTTTAIRDEFDLVIGVDTHKQTHTAAVVGTATGAHHGTHTVVATPTGYRELLGLIDGVEGRRVWAIEGCGSWGRGLYRWLDARGETVVEIERPKRPRRHMGVKDDGTDALRCAREALSQRHGCAPRAEGQRDVLAALYAVRRSALKAAVDAERQLLALANTAPESLAVKVRDRSTYMTVKTCATWRPTAHHDPAQRGIALAMHTLAQRITVLRAEVTALEREILAAVKAMRPDVLEIAGVGPIVAAVVLCAWSHPGRVRSDAAFAMLAGTAPIPASSGQTVRHRLNRQGDRQLNWAIHVTCCHRMRTDARTRRYVERRRAEGKTDREIRRCLKRYITRELFNALEKGA